MLSAISQPFPEKPGKQDFAGLYRLRLPSKANRRRWFGVQASACLPSLQPEGWTPNLDINAPVSPANQPSRGTIPSVRRRLLPILAAISLALWLAVAGLSVTSYWWSFGLAYTSPLDAHHGGFRLCVDSVSASLRICLHRKPIFGLLPNKPEWSLRWGAIDPSKGFLPDHSAERLQWIFLWPPTLLFLIAPAVWGSLWLRRFRSDRQMQRAGLCRICSYDLRAHSPGQLCPECATLIPAPPGPL